MKIGGKGNARVSREGGRVGEVVLRPGQEVGNVRGRWEASGFGKVGGVVPEVFKLVRCLHLWA